MKITHSATGGGTHRFDYAAQGIEIDLGDKKIIITQDAQDTSYDLPQVHVVENEKWEAVPFEQIEQVTWDEQRWFPEELYPGNTG